MFFISLRRADETVESEEMERDPLVSVIIPTRNRRQKLLRCVDSVLKSTWKEIEVIIVDDASDYDVKTDFASEERAKVYRNESRKLLAYSRNFGARVAAGSLLFFLDDDNVVSPEAIAELERALTSGYSAAVCSPVIYTLDQPDRVWTSYIRKGRFPGFFVLGLQVPKQSVATFSFHDAFMVKREVFEQLGGFDAEDFPIHFSELDFAYRLHLQGHESVVTPDARVWHDVGKAHMHVDAVRSFYTLRNRVILLRRYESRGDFRSYLVCILPLLLIYYIIHHLTSVTDHRFRAAFNLVRGAIAGIAAPVSPFRPGPTAGVRKAVAEEPRVELPLVSIIVPTKDSAETIGTCLDSIEAQTYPELEIIVVDNYSHDDTVSIVSRYPRVRIIVAGPERAAQFNEGAKHAAGKFLYIVDSDFVVEPGVVDEAVSRCLSDGYKVITIHNTSDSKYGFWAKVRKLERDCYEDDESHIAARFFDRTLFQHVGGFDPALIAAEDYDLHNRLMAAGYAVGRIASKEIHIGEPRALREVVVKHVFYGTKISEFIKKTPRQIWSIELSPVRIAYVRHWRSFLQDPTLTLGFFLYQYVRFASAVAGYISSLL